MSVRTAVAALSLAFAAACGGRADPREPSEANFKPAIDAHLAENPKCVGDPVFMLPVELPDPGGSTPGYQAIIGQLRTMVRLGLVSAAPAASGTRYALTDAGRQVYRTFAAGTWDPWRAVGAFCYGTAEAAGVVRWTEPSDGLGQTTTDVTYLSRLREPARWVEDPELRRQFPYVEKELSTRTTPAEAKLTLVLGSDGWRARGR